MLRGEITAPLTNQGLWGQAANSQQATSDSHSQSLSFKVFYLSVKLALPRPLYQALTQIPK